MAEITLNANIRKEVGRSYANRLRRDGRVPGVFYLHNERNIAIDVKLLDLRPLVYTAETHIVNLMLDNGTSEKCLMREVQFDPITDKVIHFDLIGLVAGEKMRVEVPIVLHGSAIGVREGGVINHIMHRVEVECFPDKIPEHIEVDISHLHIGDIVTLQDLSLPDVEFMVDMELPIVTVQHSRAEVTTAVVAEEPAEPEVIAKGKEDESKED